jgi:hypothetical protein
MAGGAEWRRFMTAIQRRPESAEGVSPTADARNGFGVPEPSDQFLSSLTAAMRRVADDARETSLSDARAAVAGKIAAMRSAAGARAEELRTRAEQDVTGIGEWSRAEIVRIEAETQRKIEQRRAQLAEQLDEHDRRSATEIAALEAQVEQYERELALFFSQLGEVTDPDTFIAAARRMPRLPEPGAEASPDNHEGRLRSLGIEPAAERDEAAAEEAPTNGSDREPEPTAHESEPVVAARTVDDEVSPDLAAPIADWPMDSTTTTIAAVGLGSFGAVTLFKSALEKTDGVSSVRLSLGSGGEFVYSVSHRADVDLAAVAGAAHPGSSVQRNEDGSVQLNAGKRR